MLIRDINDISFFTSAHLEPSQFFKQGLEVKKVSEMCCASCMRISRNATDSNIPHKLNESITYMLIYLYFLQGFCFPETTKTIYHNRWIDNFNHYSKKYKLLTNDSQFSGKYLKDTSFFNSHARKLSLVIVYLGNEAPVESYADNA